MKSPARNLRYLIPAALSLFALALLTGCSGSSDALRAIAGHPLSTTVPTVRIPVAAASHHELHVRLHGLPSVPPAALRPSVHAL